MHNIILVVSNEGVLFNNDLKCFIFVKKSYPFQLFFQA